MWYDYKKRIFYERKMKMKEIKLGFIGYGCRGKDLMEQVVLPLGMAEVTAVCDLYTDRAEAAGKTVEEKTGKNPSVYTDFMDVINDDNVNTIVIATSWEWHVDIAVEAMKAGKAVGCEVGGAYSVEQCYKLISAYEETKTPFMFLENCCFGKREMMALNMVKKGLFGEVIYCRGGYHHDLRYEVADGIKNRHYRFRNYLSRNCENYPTHEIGPIAKVLDINHGNRMISLSSFASKSAGLTDFIKRKRSDDEFLNKQTFAQSDVIVTNIKCARGETITITLDTTLPRFYSRDFTVRGTMGMYEEATDSIFLDREEDIKHDFDWRKECSGNAEKYEEEYLHPVWKDYIKEGVQGTHDGMDYLEFKTFFECLLSDEPMPIDVYDAASWMVITALSEQSIARGGAVVDIPDFTNGKWAMNIVD